jgi:hypothetical protein
MDIIFPIVLSVCSAVFRLPSFNPNRALITAYGEAMHKKQQDKGLYYV